MTVHDHLYPGLNLGSTDTETHKLAEETVFGFWIFLMSDLILFAVLFATYASMSINGLGQGPTPSDIFDLNSALLETILLLASSFTFGLAMLEMKYRQQSNAFLKWLLITGLLGVAFVGLEIHDYYTLVTDKGATPQTSGFLSAYYLLTGTHAFHVSAGIIWMIVLIAQIKMLGLTTPVKLRIMRLGLFWHMLDIVWIGIFTFVYLFGVAQ